MQKFTKRRLLTGFVLVMTSIALVLAVSLQVLIPINANNLTIQNELVKTSPEVVMPTKVDQANLPGADSISIQEWTGNNPNVTFTTPSADIIASTYIQDITVSIDLNSNTNYTGMSTHIYIYNWDGSNIDSSLVYSDYKTHTFPDGTTSASFSFPSRYLYLNGQNQFFIGVETAGDDGIFSTEDTNEEWYFSFNDSVRNVNYNALTPLYRFWSDSYQGHFYTADASEKSSIQSNNPNWRYEWPAYNVIKITGSGNCVDSNASPVYRFWSDNYKKHFYTINPNEATDVMQNNPNWRYEGARFCAFAFMQKTTGGTNLFGNVHRFWSDNYKGHFYTNDEQEKQDVQNNNPNWEYEWPAYFIKP
jgi:hypothetical protein